ncbi:unannotated protein [freshwater metagenome]|uniref:Unannotated protein n=1 Tax=freshwater metagenome TaxID=449393 RepID=A0A6J6GB47_9ZZZZ
MYASFFVAGICGLFMIGIAWKVFGPTVHPDEWGFLSNGQVMVGHTEAPIPTGSFYPAGYGVVTGLGALLTGSMSGAFRFSLMSNVLFAIITAFCAGRLAFRGFGASRVTGVVAGTLVFVMPGTIVSAMFSWPETVSRLVFVLFVAGVLATCQNPRLRNVILMGVGAGLMPALHGRFTLLLPIVCLLYLFWARKKFVSLSTAILGCAVTSLAYISTYVLNKFVKGALYAESYDQENRLLSRLFYPKVWPALLRTMVGQSWYLLATSFGLVGIAVVFACAELRTAAPQDSGRINPRKTTVSVVLLGSFLIIFTGGLQLLHGNRGDHLIYGRYVEILVPVLVVFAAVGLEKHLVLSLRAWFVSAISILLIAFTYVLIDWGDGVKGGYLRGNIVFPNIIGTDILKYVVTPSLVQFALIFAAGTLLLWLVARKTYVLALLLLTVTLGMGSMYSGQHSVLSRSDDLEQVRETIALAKTSTESRVGFDMGVRNDEAYYYLRYILHPIKLVRFDISSPAAVIPAQYLCLYGFPNKPPSDGEWRIVADEKVLQRVLWQRVGAPHC